MLRLIDRPSTAAVCAPDCSCHEYSQHLALGTCGLSEGQSEIQTVESQGQLRPPRDSTFAEEILQAFQFGDDPDSANSGPTHLDSLGAEPPATAQSSAWTVFGAMEGQKQGRTSLASFFKHLGKKLEGFSMVPSSDDAGADSEMHDCEVLPKGS